jgi:U3 small nucleolar RNA-associated protein 10
VPPTPLPCPTTHPLTPSIFPQTAFWRDDRLQQVLPVFVALVAPAGIDQDASPGGSVSGRDVVSAGLVALCDAATDDGLLKQLNLDVLMNTRAEDARVRIFALRCARALWTAQGSKLIGALRGTL